MHEVTFYGFPFIFLTFFVRCYVLIFANTGSSYSAQAQRLCLLHGLHAVPFLSCCVLSNSEKHPAHWGDEIGSYRCGI